MAASVKIQCEYWMTEELKYAEEIETEVLKLKQK